MLMTLSTITATARMTSIVVRTSATMTAETERFTATAIRKLFMATAQETTRTLLDATTSPLDSVNGSGYSHEEDEVDCKTITSTTKTTGTSMNPTQTLRPLATLMVTRRLSRIRNKDHHPLACTTRSSLDTFPPILLCPSC